MPVVVTGASGFLGASVVHALRAAGHPCLGIDRRPGSAGATALVADLLDADAAVHDALREADAVIHLAARAGVRDRDRGVDRARRRDNVLATELVLGLVPPRTPVVVTSSSSVYGGARGRACAEGDPLRPRGGYASSKVEVERLCAWRAAAGGQVTVARPFTVIGEGQRPDMALARWAAAARAGRPLTVLGSLERTRDVTDVHVVAETLVGLLERGLVTTVNIGSGRPRSLGTLVAAVARALDLAVEVRLLPAAVEEPHDTHADTTKLERLLGPRRVTDVDNAVRRAVHAPARPLVLSP
ncbi:MAG: NAD-dependent epimerase/dehydratase family protein [Geodermatophilaceae bacterium]